MEADRGVNPYLQQEVMTVSPIQLRWMLVKRAEELCLLVSKLWIEGKQTESIQWLIRIRDILSELLDGVVDPQNPVSQAVCDFYVYLLKLLNEVEQTRSPQKLQVIRDLLAIESETWKMAIEKFQSQHPTGSEPLAATSPATKPAAPIHPVLNAPHIVSGGFSLEV